MPEPWDRRQLPRVALHLPFQHKLRGPGAAGVGVGWTRDLSEGGAGLELPEFLGPRVPLELRLHTEHGPIEAEAEVVWEAAAQAVGSEASGKIQGGVPHGVAFTALSPPARHTLRTVLLSRAEAGPAGIPLPAQISATCEPENPGGPPLLGVTEAISREGLSLRLPQALPPDTAVRITLHTPDEPLTVQGTVVQVEPSDRERSGELIRHAVRFTPLGWHAALYLALLLTAHS